MASLNMMAVTTERKGRQAVCGQKPDIGVSLSDHNFISSSLLLFPSSFLFFFSNNIIFTKLWENWVTRYLQSPCTATVVNKDATILTESLMPTCAQIRPQFYLNANSNQCSN